MYFKDAVILFDGLDEVICHGQKNFLLMHVFALGKVLLPSSFVA